MFCIANALTDLMKLLNMCRMFLWFLKSCQITSDNNVFHFNSEVNFCSYNYSNAWNPRVKFSVPWLNHFNFHCTCNSSASEWHSTVALFRSLIALARNSNVRLLCVCTLHFNECFQQSLQLSSECDFYFLNNSFKKVFFLDNLLKQLLLHRLYDVLEMSSSIFVPLWNLCGFFCDLSQLDVIWLLVKNASCKLHSVLCFVCMCFLTRR